MKPHIDDYAKFHPNLSMFIKKLKMSSDLMNFIDISNYFISKIHRIKIKNISLHLKNCKSPVHSWIKNH